MPTPAGDGPGWLEAAAGAVAVSPSEVAWAHIIRSSNITRWDGLSPSHRSLTQRHVPGKAHWLRMRRPSTAYYSLLYTTHCAEPNPLWLLIHWLQKLFPSISVLNVTSSISTPLRVAMETQLINSRSGRSSATVDSMSSRLSIVFDMVFSPLHNTSRCSLSSHWLQAYHLSKPIVMVAQHLKPWEPERTIYPGRFWPSCLALFGPRAGQEWPTQWPKSPHSRA